MSVAPDYTVAIACEAIIKNIADWKGVGDPQTKTHQTGLIEAILSPLNRQGISSDEFQGNGGASRQVRVNHFPRRIEDIVTPVSLRDNIPCTGATCAVSTPVEETIGITNDWSTCLTFDLDTVRDFCGIDKPLYENIQMKAAMDGVDMELNRLAWTYLNANWGLNITPNIATVHALTMFANGVIDPIVWRQFIFEWRKNQNKGKPILIGDQPISDLASIRGATCCNNDGVDLQAVMNQFGFAAYLDDQMTSITGNPNDVAVLEQGALQMFTYNETTVAEDHQGVMRFVVPHPTLPIDFDARMTYDCANHTYTLRLSLFHEFWSAPDTVYTIGDTLRPTSDAVNGTYFYQFN